MTTQDTQELFGELRSAAQDQDHANGWTRMVTAIDKWQDLDSFKEQALPYLKESLKERGADVARPAPASWADAHGLHPAIELANGLDLTACPLDDAAIAAIIADPRLEGFTALRLDNTQASDATLAALVSAPHLAAIHNLSFDGCTKLSAAAITSLATATNLPALQRLDISNLGLNVDALEPLFNSAFLLKLHDLQFLGNTADHRDDLFGVFYEFMEDTEEYGDGPYDDYDEDEGDEDGEGGAEPDEDAQRLASLRASVEGQVLRWAEDISDGRGFMYFHDLME